ncbi:MAG: hypothetical protein OXG98_12345 [Gemmatimonadetes bacterium]|nr:hypothetical protein [Gemmatimonadota bacterium]
MAEFLIILAVLVVLAVLWVIRNANDGPAPDRIPKDLRRRHGLALPRAPNSTVRVTQRVTHASHIWIDFVTLCERPIRGMDRDADLAAYRAVDACNVVFLNESDTADQLDRKMHLVTCRVCQRSRALARRLDDLEQGITDN